MRNAAASAGGAATVAGEGAGAAIMRTAIAARACTGVAGVLGACRVPTHHSASACANAAQASANAHARQAAGKRRMRGRWCGNPALAKGKGTVAWAGKASTAAF